MLPIVSRRLLCALFLTGAVALAQPAPGSLRVKLGLKKLQTLGSVLMIAAHPDDENTALLAYFAQGRHCRTGYLSLTRGEGGQNLIGSEQGALMGVIRTQELLAARRLDGAEQFFTSAIDFGFSKTAEETLRKWGREQVLGDVVWTIRRFRPDVIVLRFSGTPRDGHGHHQASALLGLEAFTAAADPKRFPEQLKMVEPWKARRIFWNVFSFTREQERDAAAMPNRITVDTGAYSPELGYSYGEIAGMSRSMHRSQGMGTALRKGSQPQHLVLRAGEPAKEDPLEGIDVSWNRVPGGGEVAELLAQAEREFDAGEPSRVIPKLLEARKKIAAIAHPWAEQKRRELEELVAEAASLWLDASANRAAVSPGMPLSITVSAINRSPAAVQLMGVRFRGLGAGDEASVEPAPLLNNRLMTRTVKVVVPAEQPYSQPYWLREAPSETRYSIRDWSEAGLAEGAPVMEAIFRLRFDAQELELVRPVLHRYVDAVKGELTSPLAVVPAVAVEFATRTVVFPTAEAKQVDVRVRAQAANQTIALAPRVPAGWRVEPGELPVTLKSEGEVATASFTVHPPATESNGTLELAGQVGMNVIAYDHIPPQTVFPEAKLKLVRTDARLLAKNVGYVMGAGDEVPAALAQLGAKVTLLNAGDLAHANLSAYDAIVTGVRAYNVRSDLRASQQRLLDYVAAGGVLIVQYNVLEGGFGGRETRSLERIGPLPITISRTRVTVEDAPMEPVNPDSPLLLSPNRIEPKDYEGWVQERGLYFASEWDAAYQPLWRMNDPNEKPTEGGTLVARHGKGVYIFTPLAWFRQLPAGVPGAYRLFANFLSAGKVMP
jgi:LmbE family N-acetylglucosaminyl deacetylase